MDKTGLHCFVSGRVQGVFFRSCTKEKAIELGLTGWVKNLTDGRVEAMIYGEKDKISIIKEWLQQGPNASKVEKINTSKEQFDPSYTSFKIVY